MFFFPPTKIAKSVAKPQQTVKHFVPIVTSLKNMTFNFGTTPKSQANNPQTAPKSSAKSMALPVSNKPSKHVTPSANAGRKSVGSTKRGKIIYILFTLK